MQALLMMQVWNQLRSGLCTWVCRAVVDWKMQPATKGEQGSPTDMGYPVYPPSLYRRVIPRLAT